MRPPLVACALASSVFLIVPTPARADVSCELIVAFSPHAPRDCAARLDRGSRYLRPIRCLADHLPSVQVAPSAAARTPGCFDLDPSRLWLFQARDSAAAFRALQMLQVDPSVAWVERNVPRVPQVWSYTFAPGAVSRTARDRASFGDANVPAPADSSFPDDPLFRNGAQWALENRGGSAGTRGADIGARAAWRISTGSNQILLAIADTGMDLEHPELAAMLPEGGPRIIGARDVVANGSVRDLYGHGTPVTGVAAARTNDGAHVDSLGIAGVCGGDGFHNFGCRIVPIKITPGDRGEAASFDIAAAILYATQLGARAVNVSFAGDLPSRLERLACQHAITHGCVPVLSSGNRGVRDGARPQYPAAYAQEGLGIQVGASDAWDRRAPFSSFGPGLDVLAPGVDVWTTYMTYPSAQGGVHPGYVAASGTSFAAPFVTGAVGVMAATRPELMDVDFQQILRRSAHDLGATGRDVETGWGRLDLAAALRAIGPDVGIWHDEVAADRFEPLEWDTLRISEPGFGSIEHAGTFPAQRVRASATVAIPDSFVAPVVVWPRVGGTTTLRGDFEVPYFMPRAEIVAMSDRAFTIGGYFYRTRDTSIPLPEDQARFGFTVMGRVARARHDGETRRAAAPQPSTIRVRPNPFAHSTRIETALRGQLELFDLNGRRVRHVTLGGSFGPWEWDGADDRGASLAPGVYLARWTSARGTESIKLLKLE